MKNILMKKRTWKTLRLYTHPRVSFSLTNDSFPSRACIAANIPACGTVVYSCSSDVRPAAYILVHRHA